MGGHSLQERCRGDLGRDAVGHGHELSGSGCDAPGIAAGDVRPGDARSRVCDPAGAFDPDDRGRLGAIVSVALVDVAKVDPDGLDIDQHFPVVRRRIGHVPRLEHLGTTVTLENDGSHDSANAASGAGIPAGSRRSWSRWRDGWQDVFGVIRHPSIE